MGTSPAPTGFEAWFIAWGPVVTPTALALALGAVLRWWFWLPMLPVLMIIALVTPPLLATFGAPLVLWGIPTGASYLTLGLFDMLLGRRDEDA